MKKIPTSRDNYNFYLKADLSKYQEGEWIGIAKNKIMAHGDDAGKVYRAAQKKAGTDDVALAKIPQEGLITPSVYF